jgi:hypothetical protein
MRPQVPAIAKLASRLLLDIEQAVRRFARYHRYQVGADLRTQAMAVARLVNHAWREREARARWLQDLGRAIDELRLTMQLAKDVRAWASFEQFEAVARLVDEIGRQVGGWRKKQHPTGQNAPASAPEQRAQRLSTCAACLQAMP